MTAMISDSSPRAHRKGRANAGRSAEGPATAALMPLLDVPGAHRISVVAAFLLGAIARDAFGDPDAAELALQRVLDLAEPDQVLFPYPVRTSPRPHDRQARHHAADAALISETADLLARVDRLAPPPGKEGRPLQALTHGETRVLRYLPTNLSAREIADELYLSVNTVKTHQRHLYQKLGARTRTQAVEQARALGLLAPSSRRR
jgi:LuxR family maltose regulon positive regulatory protein